MLIILLIIIFIYLIQSLICSITHICNNTRDPKGFIDFLKLTFLPYVLFNLKNIK
jgi:hypothetical protein